MSVFHVEDTFLLGTKNVAVIFCVCAGAKPVNALVTEIDVPKNQDGKYIINYSNFEGNTKESMEVDYIIGADGANSRVAKV